jgi:hypothetical protein
MLPWVGKGLILLVLVLGIAGAALADLRTTSNVGYRLTGAVKGLYR